MFGCIETSAAHDKTSSISAGIQFSKRRCGTVLLMPWNYPCRDTWLAEILRLSKGGIVDPPSCEDSSTYFWVLLLLVSLLLAKVCLHYLRNSQACVVRRLWP